MKKYIIKTFCIVISIIVLSTFLTACKKEEPMPSISGFSYLDVYPDWLENEPDHSLEMLSSINNDAKKAVYLFRQACYNETDMDKYVYFLNGGGGSVFFGANITMKAQTTRIQNGDNSFHQMINLVTQADKSEALVKSFLSRSYQRIIYDNKRYYRKGENSEFDANDILIAAWKDFEITELSPKSNEAVQIDEEYLNNRYKTKTSLDFGLYTLPIESYNSDNLVLSEGTTVEQKVDGNGHTYYKVVMAIDINIANSNEKTIESLRKETDANPVTYSEFTIEFEVWQNGLFKYLNPIEGWSGTIKKVISVSGSSNAANPRTYSYHPDDCDLSKHIEILPQ